jgi:hypothetical protein
MPVVPNVLHMHFLNTQCGKQTAASVHCLLRRVGVWSRHLDSTIKASIARCSDNGNLLGVGSRRRQRLTCY